MPLILVATAILVVLVLILYRLTGILATLASIEWYVQSISYNQSKP